jgi:hypothetical protein
MCAVVEAAGAGVGDADREMVRAAGGAAQLVVEGLHADVLGHLRAIEGAAMAAGVAPHEDGEGARGEVGEEVLAGRVTMRYALRLSPVPVSGSVDRVWEVLLSASLADLRCGAG